MMGGTMEKLSSGLRINRADDDPSGLVISEQMRAQIVGFKAAVKNSEKGISMIQTAEAAEEDPVRARAVMEELAGTLNMAQGGLIALNLWNLYVFFIQKITEANLTKDPVHVEAVLPSLKELRDGWSQMEVPPEDAETQTLDRRVSPAGMHHRMSVTG